MNRAKPQLDGAAGGSNGFSEHAEQVVHSTEELSTALLAAADDVRRYLTAQTRHQPYTTLAVAAGVGYVLGGGLQTRLTTRLLSIAARLAVAIVARDASQELSRRSPLRRES